MKSQLSAASKYRIPVSDKGLAICRACKIIGSLLPDYPLTLAPLLLALGVVMGTVLGTAITAHAGPRGATPWAVIKCKFSDQLRDPTFDPEFITGAYGMAAYWSGVSYGLISLDGSAVYPENGGWYTLPFTLAQAQAFNPLTRRKQIIDACIAAAPANINVTDFHSVIAIVNAVIDSGSDGGRVLLDPDAWNVTFAGHEMGHNYIGVNHSFDDTQTVYCPGYKPGEYGDGWDIMSAMTFGGSNPTVTGLFGASGPGLNAPNLDRLGWLVANRVSTWDYTSETLTLAALNRPLATGYLMAKVPIDAANPNHYYTVEFRRKIDWDEGIPRDTALIHEIRADGISVGLSYLIRANGGPERLQDQTFRDINNNVAITVLGMDAPSSTATINIGRNEVWVDFNDPGLFDEFGTFDMPYNTLATGLNYVAYNGTLKIKAGSANETATINRKMTIEAYGGPVTIGR